MRFIGALHRAFECLCLPREASKLRLQRKVFPWPRLLPLIIIFNPGLWKVLIFVFTFPNIFHVTKQPSTRHPQQPISIWRFAQFPEVRGVKKHPVMCDRAGSLHKAWRFCNIPAALGREALSAVASGSNSHGSLLYVEFAARYINVYNFVQLFL